MIETSLTIEEIRFFVVLIEIGIILGLLLTGVGLLLNYDRNRKQGKVDSARFTVDYVDKIIDKGKDVIDTLYDREKDNTQKFKKDKDVRVLLNGFENTVQFVNDKVIDKKQMLNTTRIALQMLKKDTEVQRIIQEKQQDKPKAFDKVIKFMNEEID